MSELNIEEFNPSIAEITLVVSKYKDLTIQGVNDTVGYSMIDTARKELKRIRIEITKRGKSMREEAILFQKAVIAKENQLIALVEPTERELEFKQKAIDDEKERIKRSVLRPERIAKLSTINLKVSEDWLDSLNDIEFQTFFNEKNTEYLAEKERKINEEQAKIDAEKLSLLEAQKAEEREKQRQKELEQAKIEAAEKSRIDTENRLKREQEQKELAEKEEREKLEKEQRYTDFLAANNYIADGSFMIDKQGSKITLYKKIAELNI
jgi:hypothetical protein